VPPDPPPDEHDHDGPARPLGASRRASLAAELRAWLTSPSAHRQWAIDANDGVIATAGLLQGFAGAGAGDRLLLFTATAATIAGGLSTGGAKWAEDAAERDAQLWIIERERQDLAHDPTGELDELTAHWQHKGLPPELARQVAEHLDARDALGAQLEWEYGFDEPMAASDPLWAGVGSTLAYAVGALIPLLITYFAPVRIETPAILVAVLVALALTSVVASRTAHLDARRMLLRSVAVGVLTLGVSYAVGSLLLDG
jgi:VIT1/CCC1 family predicted Fe2+/Mn2+ transporter